LPPPQPSTPSESERPEREASAGSGPPPRAGVDDAIALACVGRITRALRSVCALMAGGGRGSATALVWRLVVHASRLVVLCTSSSRHQEGLELEYRGM